MGPIISKVNQPNGLTRTSHAIQIIYANKAMYDPLAYHHNPPAIHSLSGSGTTQPKLPAINRSRTSRLCNNDIAGENQTLHRPEMDILNSPCGSKIPIFPPHTTSHLMVILLPSLVRVLDVKSSRRVEIVPRLIN